MTAGREAPGPKGEPVLGSARAFQRDIMRALLDARREHGDVVRFTGIGPLFPVYLVAHPDGVKHVLQDNHRNYPKTPFVSDRWRALVGEGLICSEGTFWRQQRRLCQPVFHRSLAAHFGEVTTGLTAQLLESWQEAAAARRDVDVTADITHLTLAVLGQALFGADWQRDAAVMADAVEATIGQAYRKFGRFVGLPDAVPTPSNLRFRAARRRLDEIIYRVIAARGSGDHRGDLLAALLDAAGDDEGMSTAQVRNEVMTFMFGGHETVAAGLTWALYLLSRHPMAADRLAAESRSVLGDRRPAVDDIADLPFAGRVVHECLRLYPPVWLISRTPLEDDVIAGFAIPKGATVLLSPFVTHRHPDFWDDPEGFDPDRWASPELADAAGRHRFGWWPFSGGPRKCIGDHFGMLETHLVLTMIAGRFAVSLVPGHPVLPRPGITLGQRYGIAATLRSRDRST